MGEYNGKWRFIFFNVLLMIIAVLSAEEIDIECEFSSEEVVLSINDVDLPPEPQLKVYTCNLTTEITKEVTIKQIKGHSSGSGDGDVKALYVKEKSFKLFPTNLGEKFPNLREIYIDSSNIEVLRNKDLLQFPELKYLTVKNSFLSYIMSELFDGITKLEYVDLSNNPVSYIGQDPFSGPTSLKAVDFTDLACDVINRLYLETEIDTLESYTSEDEECMKPLTFEILFVDLYKADLENKGTNLLPTTTTQTPSTTSQPICECPTTPISSTPSSTTQSTTTSSITNSSTQTTSTVTTTSLSPISTTTQPLTTSTTIPPSTPQTSTTLPYPVTPYPCEADLAAANREINNLKADIEKLYKEIEALLPSSVTCRFRLVGDIYECLAMKINIKTTSSVGDQKITWKGSHLTSKKDSDVQSLILKSQTAQLLPLEIGKSFSKLEILAVESSDLQKLKKNDFKTLENLKNLSLINNDISSIEGQTFDILTDLIHLNLRGNKIVSFPSRAFEKLESVIHLDVGNNEFSSFRYDMIPSTNSIKHFYMDSNKNITSIDILMVWRLSKADVIDFTDTSCNLKFEKVFDLSFKAFFSSITSKCS